MAVGLLSVSFPPPLSRQTIAPSVPLRHHCQDAPNRFSGAARLSIRQVETNHGNHRPSRTRSSRTPRAPADHRRGRLRLCAGQRLGCLYVSDGLRPSRPDQQVDSSCCPFSFLRVQPNLPTVFAWTSIALALSY